MGNVQVRDVNTLYCSFCGKSQYEAKKLIAGPNVFICDECVGLCDEIIEEENKPPEAVAAENDFVKQAREWLTQDHWVRRQRECTKDCDSFDARVDAGHFDKDPRILGYVEGLRKSSDTNAAQKDRIDDQR